MIGLYIRTFVPMVWWAMKHGDTWIGALTTGHRIARLNVWWAHRITVKEA